MTARAPSDDEQPGRPPAPIDRRAFGRILLAGVFTAGGVTLVGCSSASTPAAASSTSTTSAPSSPATSSSAASSGPAASSSAPGSSAAPPVATFPITVTHKFGTTTVPKRPVRVVSAGYTEHDTLLALGVIPVGVTDWYGDQPYATWPWARKALGSAQPTVLSLTDGFQFEKIAALQPDLIIGTNAGMQAADYQKLSAIAPTIAQSGKYTDYFEPWHVQSASIGTAVGLSAEANTLIASIRAGFATAAKANPAFAGTSAIFLQNAVYEGSAIAYQQGLSTEFLTDLGFTVPPELDKFAKDGGQAYVPVEQLSVLNSGEVLIWATEADKDLAALEKVPGFTGLTAVKDDKSVYTGGELAGAIYFTTPLSLPYVLDRLVPMLSKVL